MDAWVTIVSPVTVSFVVSAVTGVIGYVRFKAIIEERQKHFASQADLQLLAQDVERTEKDIERGMKYATEIKHLHVDPYTRATDVLKQRVDQMQIDIRDIQSRLNQRPHSR